MTQVQCLLHNSIIHLKIKNFSKIIHRLILFVKAIDQTRGWFYTLHAIHTMLFDNLAYKNIMVNVTIIG